MEKKNWFVTGASRGFGRLWTEAALARGDKVVATARDSGSLADLTAQYGEAVLALPLDVTDTDAVFAAVKAGHDHFGRLDVILSNAGYGMLGAVEEVDIKRARTIFDTNFFGTLAVIQAALPHLRAQGSGHILAVSSLAGLISFPLGGLYHASKYAVVGLAESLAQEVAPFGIKVTVIEPGPFATEFMGAASFDIVDPIPAYLAGRQALLNAFNPEFFADPTATTEFVLRAVDSTEPPVHLLLGPVRAMIEDAYAARRSDWDAWAAVTGD